MTSRSSSRSPSPTTTSTVVETPASQSQINSHLRDHACVACARRKVKCDKVDPTCSNCRKSRQPCIYTEPQPRKPRKRAADGDLLARIARYEDLMRQNGVDYAPYANVWVPSGLEKEQNEQDEVEQPPRGRHDRTAVLQSQAAPVRSLWHDLPHELKYPPVQTLRAPDDPLLHPTPSLQSIVTDAATGNAPSLGSLHPAPRQNFVLWQRFVDQVNPLTKIVHVPTLQPRVLEASGSPDAIQSSLHALLFVIYTLSVTSMSPNECEAQLGEPKTKLMTRYRTATLRALVAADFFVTRDLEVLQALVLFLLSDPESDLTHSLTGVAMRLGQRMGLNHVDTSGKISPFEQEMRIRLWWPLCGLAGRASSGLVQGHPNGNAHAAALKTALLELGDLRTPLNVNDADLHPDMAELPAERTGPTEMLCVRMKFEFGSWVRSSPATTQMFESIVRTKSQGESDNAEATTSTRSRTESGAEAIRRIQTVYEARYLCHLDKRIPLHSLVHAMIQLALARMRFALYHPRHSGRQQSKKGREEEGDNNDVLFESALTMLEMVDYGLKSPFASHLFTYMTSPFQMDAYIYVLSDLRKRVSGERGAVAWRLVEGVYDAHPELVQADGKVGDPARSTLYKALGELVLEAWTARETELKAELRVQGKQSQGDVAVPWYIRCLKDKKDKEKEKEKERLAAASLTDDVVTAIQNPYSAVLDGVGSLDDSDAAWTYWEDFLRL